MRRATSSHSSAARRRGRDRSHTTLHRTKMSAWSTAINSRKRFEVSQEDALLSQLNPPFRAEHIGSLLRPKSLLDQRGRFARGEISREALAAAEDAAIKEALALQERVGLKFATDGEFRRRSYHSFFYRQLGELSIDTVAGADAKGGNAGRRGAQPVAVIDSRVRWTKPINVAD